MSPHNPNPDRIYEDPDENDDDDDDIILISSTRERWERLHGIQAKYKNRLDVDGLQDDDDIVVVAVKPTPTRKKWWTDSRFGSSFQSQMIALGIAFLIWMAMKRTKKLSTAKEKVESQTTNSEAEEDNGVIDNHTEGEDAIELANNSTEETQSSTLPAAATTTTMLSSMETTNRRLSNTPQDTRELAEQFARDVKLVQDVLKEHSLDPSLAPQLAMSLQNSQQIIDSQRELSYQNALLDAHQRNLDRQLSREQHQESCKSARFDPNWKEKLERLRDECGYWNGGIGRLLVEVLSIQQLSFSIVPVWQKYCNSSEEELDIAIASILREAFASVLSQVCGCDSTNKQIASEYSTTATATFSSSPASLYFALMTMLDHFAIEQWTCYGYCAIIAFATLCVAILCHQGLRILSLPKTLHHVVNLAALSAFYGPQHMLSWVVGTLKKMFLVNTDGTSVSMACSFLLLSLWVLLPLWSWNKTFSMYNQGVRNIVAAHPFNFEAVFGNERSKLKQWHREQMKLRYFLLSVYSALVLWENASTQYTN